jgi:hypothetical protein
MKNKLKTAVLVALDRASREMSLKILEDEATREGIARILLEEIEKKGVVKELADREPNQLHEDMSSTVMDVLRMMIEEIKRTRETVIDGQTLVAKTISNVVRQEGEHTREKIEELLWLI